MREKLIEFLPEIKWIFDKKLQDAVIATYQETLQIAGLEVEDMKKVAFVWDNISNATFSYLDHVRVVTKMCKPILAEYNVSYAEKIGYSLDKLKYSLDHDTLIAGVILHDVGKLLEYELTPDGRTVESSLGKYLRHPISGAAVAFKNGVPANIIHIIATHSREGNGGYRSPEAIAVIKIDNMNFETIKSHSNIFL
ncbi:MAG: metal dependent phosphohydrolase [Firmicutes bacterium]|nr:metal dependent phosphohydrolase [Bacillota bacterium]